MGSTTATGGLLVALALSLGLGACSSGPSEDEAAVCRALEGMAANADFDARFEAMAAYEELQAAIDGTSNEVLGRNGADLVDFLSDDAVDDASVLTAEQSAEVGDQVLAEADRYVDALLLECERVGAPVRGLPTSEER